MRQPDEPPDELDAALDGRQVEVDGDLAALLEAAASLSTALRAIELDPAAAERHLGAVLDDRATVLPLPARPAPPRRPAGRWRRRLAAVAVAAALTVVPAAAASASESALPGQVLYPVKLAVEQVRVTAVSWSGPREAGARIGIAGTRLQELDRLVQLNAADRIPPALVRLDHAYAAAERAVDDAGGTSQAPALERRLEAVDAACMVTVDRIKAKLVPGALPADAQRTIADTMRRIPLTRELMAQPPPPHPNPTATTTAAPGGATPGSQPSGPGPATTAGAPASTQASATTEPPATTEAPATTTEPPTTTETQAPAGQSSDTDTEPATTTGP